MKLLTVLGLALLLCSAASGTTIIVSGLHSTLGMQSSLYFDEDGAATLEYWAGGIDILVNGYARLVFCVDLFTNISLSTYNTQLDFADTPQLQRVGWLLQTQLPTIKTQAGGAALQLAIWDIMTDNGDGFAAGKGRITQSTDSAHPTDPTVLATAINLESLSAGQHSLYGFVYHNTQISNGVVVQTLMGANVYDGGPEPIPEPSPLLLVLGGAVLMGAGSLHARKSGKIESDGERSDFRREELTGNARG